MKTPEVGDTIQATGFRGWLTCRRVTANKAGETGWWAFDDKLVNHAVRDTAITKVRKKVNK